MILTGQYFALAGNYEKRALKFAIEVFLTSFKVEGCQLNQLAICVCSYMSCICCIRVNSVFNFLNVVLNFARIYFRRSLTTSFPGLSPTRPSLRRAGRRETWERGWAFYFVIFFLLTATFLQRPLIPAFDCLP